MSKEIKVLLGIVLVAVISIVLSINTSNKQEPAVGGSEYLVPFTVSATSSAITVGTSSTFVTATSTFNQYAIFVNDGSYPIYLQLKSDAPAVANSGIRLNSGGGAYEMLIDQGNFYTGSIRAIAVGGSSVLTVMGR